MQKTIIALMHLGYWFLYVMLWTVIILLIEAAAQSVNNNTFKTWRFVLFITSFGVIPAALGFYTYYWWLFKRFLQTRKILVLFAVGFLIAIACGLASAVIIGMSFPAFSFFGDGFNSVGSIVGVLSIIALLNGGMGLVIKGFITWYAEIKLKETLAEKNFEMELALVKSQINPHFLFNTLNNIDVLIGKDATRASSYLNKLSDIMRFMLYETKTEKIPLSKELEYIEKYIDLQRIRTAVPNYVKFVVEGEVSDLLIEPMLFIPIVENAFKHSAIREKENAVDIYLRIDQDCLTFECKNKYKEGFRGNEAYGGLGNELIQKRLLSLYPNKHTLDISKNGDTYHVKLTLHQSWKSLAS